MSIDDDKVYNLGSLYYHIFRSIKISNFLKTVTL